MAEPARWDDPRLRWDMPGLFWDGDVPTPTAPPSPRKPRHRMKRQPYLPDNDPDILTFLVTLDTNLPGALATKYDVDAAQLLRLRHGRYAFGWFLEAAPIARQWSQSLTDARRSMTDSEPATLVPLPGLPVLPPVPTFNTPPVTTQLEPGFFDFLGRLVQQIKNHASYDEADGILLKIVGAEVPPPDPAIVPVVKWEFAPSGCPLLIGPKAPFQGYKVWAARGTAPLAEVGFSTTRKFELMLPLPRLRPGRDVEITGPVPLQKRSLRPKEPDRGNPRARQLNPRLEGTAPSVPRSRPPTEATVRFPPDHPASSPPPLSRSHSGGGNFHPQANHAAIMKARNPSILLHRLGPFAALLLATSSPSAKATEALLTDDSTIYTGSAAATRGPYATTRIDSVTTKSAVLRFEITSMLPAGVTADNIERCERAGT